MSAYELGKAQPRPDVLVALCKYFDVSADYLLGLSDIRHTAVDLTCYAAQMEKAYGCLVTIGQLAADGAKCVEEVR
jgi:transcriptional regulator with XRE-family HTH domain